VIRLAVFGWPVAQSLSPAIHALFARQFDLNVDYRAIEASPAEFPQKLQQFAAQEALGCNITAPHKHAAFLAANELSNAAQRAQAVNTLVFRSAGDWYGTTTDGDGLLQDLKREFPAGLGGKRILMMGAGGAAAGVLGSLLLQAPGSVSIANRNVARGNELASRFSDLGPVHAIGLTELEQQRPFDLLINATSLGHQGIAPKIPPACFNQDGFCYDLNYGKASIPMQRLCAELGCRFSDGLGMLVEQAALSFALWTGNAPETKTVLQDIRQLLENR
jgi:shikimate dehydrogenase